MGRHRIHDGEGNDTGLHYRDDDGDWSPKEHQTVYRETDYGIEKVDDIHYDPSRNHIHRS